jgi:hypothetical protein
MSASDGDGADSASSVSESGNGGQDTNSGAVSTDSGEAGIHGSQLFVDAGDFSGQSPNGDTFVMVGGDMLAGNSADMFVFPQDNASHDAGGGFVDHDIIELSVVMVEDFTAVQSAMNQVGQDVVLTVDSTDTVTLHKIALMDLDAHDFSFF